MRETPRSVSGVVKRIAAALGILALAWPALHAAAQARSSARRSPVVQVVERVSPAVVNISAEQILRRRSIWDDFYFGLDPRRRGRAESLGSGVILYANGILLTNEHVVADASRILVTTKSGLELECDVVGADADNDLAVLRARKAPAGLPTIKLGTSSDLMIGETIVAIGNPFGFSNTVTAGVVSAVGRSVRGRQNQRTYTDFIQIDAPINPGNSGGPVVNIDGELIGIATAIIGGAEGIGFAIPIDRAKRIVDDLLRFGSVRAVWIGVRGRTLSDPDDPGRRGRGFEVRRVDRDSPAAKAGIKAGDVIVSVDGAPVDSEEAFGTALSTRGPGKPFRLGVRRGTAERSVTVAGQTVPKGVALDVLREELGISLRETRDGLRITITDADGPAARRGLETGDTLVAVDGKPVKRLDDVSEALRDLGRSAVVLEVQRGRWSYQLPFALD
jgi:serine protease Do